MPKHPWTSSLNLKKGRKNGFRFQPYGIRREVRLVDVGIDSPYSSGHRVIKATDIGQAWMRQQAALDYSYEIWRKLLSPTQFVAPIVDEES